MNTIHRWFRSGIYSLMGHLDVPELPCGRLGVLMVPPFGWEDVCSYRPLRILGKSLAASGLPVLRFDLPGTGDSSGNALDAGLFEAWIQSVGDAAAELRAATGVVDVSVVGIRMGAMLALAAASRGSNLQDLVLWGATAKGRSMLRELRAFSRMEHREYSNGDASAPQPVPGLEISGFLLAPETQQAIEELALTTLPEMHGRHVLLLSRDEVPTDAKLMRALESAGCALTLETGSGYAAMMAMPQEAIPPVATGRLIAEFLTTRLPLRHNCLSTTNDELGAVAHFETQSSRTVLEDAGIGVLETIFTVDRSSESMFGILSGPALPAAQPSEWCVLFLNAGAVRHIGPNRMWVEAARRWAAQGVVCLRLDLTGIGESDGAQSLGTAELYQDHMVQQIEIAMDSLRSRLDIQRFIAIGLCSGAFWAFHAALRNLDVRAAIMLNPRLFFWDPEVDRRRLFQRTLKGVSEWEDWCRLARGYVPLEKIKKVARVALDRIQTSVGDRRLQIQPQAMARAWAAIERSQSCITLIFTEGEPLLTEMHEEGQMPPETCSRVQCLQVANGGHTFRPLWAQKLAHELIDSELDKVLREGRPDPADADLGKRCATSETQRR